MRPFDEIFTVLVQFDSFGNTIEKLFRLFFNLLKAEIDNNIVSKFINALCIFRGFFLEERNWVYSSMTTLLEHSVT